VRFSGCSSASRLLLRALAGLAFFVTLGLQVLAIGRTLRELVHDDVVGCLMMSLLALVLSLTLPIFWTLSRR